MAPDRDADPVLNNLERRTFRYFLEHGQQEERHGAGPLSHAVLRQHRRGWLRPDRVFAGAERGYVSRAQARLRVLPTLRFLEQLPQVPRKPAWPATRGSTITSCDMKTGLRYGTAELSTVDTALLLGGVLLCQSYFDRESVWKRRFANSPKRSTAGSTGAGRRIARPPSRTGGGRRPAFCASTGAATTKRCWSTSSRSVRRPTRSTRGLAANGRRRTTDWGKFSGQEFLSFGPHVRPPVLACVDRLPRHPGRVHAREGHRLFENSRRATYASETMRSTIRCAGAVTTAKSGA